MGYEVFSRCIPIENDILYRTRKTRKEIRGGGLTAAPLLD
jgi:hypothetical protein